VRMCRRVPVTATLLSMGIWLELEVDDCLPVVPMLKICVALPSVRPTRLWHETLAQGVDLICQNLSNL
jgi:hypothetical protein